MNRNMQSPISSPSESPGNTKVILVANTSWYLYNFRLPLLKELRSAGYTVEAIAPHDEYTHLIQHEGFKIHHWVVTRSSINPFLEMRALADLAKLYRRERPDLVHHFTIKACVYGTLAAKSSRIYRVVNSITGLGHLFVGRRKRTRLLRRALKPVYKAVFTAKRSTVVFQNAEDQERLIQLGITDGERARLIHGSGVDIEHFKPTEDSAGKFHDPVKLLFPSRLIKEKGIYDVLKAFLALRENGEAIELLIAGDIDDGNRSSLSKEDLSALRNDSQIKLLGHVNDMRSLYANSDIIILPSWREGLSRSLIEAAAMERAIVTTDVPGCREVIDHGDSGLLIPPKDPRSLELAITLLLQQPDLARRLGKQARQKVFNEFQVSLVNEKTLGQYKELFSAPSRYSRIPSLSKFISKHFG